jgi:hypothetical protein
MRAWYRPLGPFLTLTLRPRARLCRARCGCQLPGSGEPPQLEMHRTSPGREQGVERAHRDASQFRYFFDTDNRRAELRNYSDCFVLASVGGAHLKLLGVVRPHEGKSSPLTCAASKIFRVIQNSNGAFCPLKWKFPGCIPTFLVPALEAGRSLGARKQYGQPGLIGRRAEWSEVEVERAATPAETIPGVGPAE